MARQPFFSGNYGSALGQIDTRPIMQGAAAQAAMYQNLGANIGGAIEKYQLNKVKREKEESTAMGTLAGMSPEERSQFIHGNPKLETAVETKSPTAGPTFTGTPAAPTAAAGTNTTQLATTAFVTSAIANTINGAPGALDTLNELAAALNDDANAASNLTTLINARSTSADGTHTGTTNIALLKISSGLTNAANDTAAASGCVAVNQLYRNGSVVMIRVS